MLLPKFELPTVRFGLLGMNEFGKCCTLYCGVYRLLLLTAPFALVAAPPAVFTAHTVAAHLKGGYQVVAADMNGDRRPDLIAVESGSPELAWFENPTWERHVIATGMKGMINLAARDIDGDGIPEIVLASEFSMTAKKSAGVISVLKHQGDPRKPWSRVEIDRLPTSHRIRWANIDGSGKWVAVNAPLTAADVDRPEQRSHTPLVFYRPGDWKRELIGDQNEGVMHGIYVVDWDGDGRDEILTASYVGIHIYKLGRDGRWICTELTKGDPAPWPKCGASDVAAGKLGRRRFLAAIEPWHGNQVVIYTAQRKQWKRHVIDDSFVDGHTVVTGDLNGDGRDEVVAGFRGKGRSAYIYSAEDAKGASWGRQALDQGGMGAAACVIADLNADRRPDIACVDSPSLKWYENAGIGR